MLKLVRKRCNKCFVMRTSTLALMAMCGYVKRDRTLCRGNMPVQAKANNLELSAIPHELSDLNQLELWLVSLRVPFMKMVALPSGKQRSIHGPAVNVPSKLDNICSVLPRLPSQTELIPLKLKRKLVYRKHYMYDFISPEKVLNALRWLKANNPLYADVDINVHWMQESISEDTDLFGSLVGQPSTSEENSDSELPTEDTTTATHRHNLPGKSLPSGIVGLSPKM